MEAGSSSNFSTQWCHQGTAVKGSCEVYEFGDTQYECRSDDINGSVNNRTGCQILVEKEIERKIVKKKQAEEFLAAKRGISIAEIGGLIGSVLAVIAGAVILFCARKKRDMIISSPRMSPTRSIKYRAPPTSQSGKRPSHKVPTPHPKSKPGFSRPASASPAPPRNSVAPRWLYPLD